MGAGDITPKFGGPSRSEPAAELAAVQIRTSGSFHEPENDVVRVPRDIGPPSIQIDAIDVIVTRTEGTPRTGSSNSGTRRDLLRRRYLRSI